MYIKINTSIIDRFLMKSSETHNKLDEEMKTKKDNFLYLQITKSIFRRNFYF